MENSFYYFFSATPQVLAGIISLFGVLVIFKLDSIKFKLLGIGESILEFEKIYLESTLGEKLNIKILDIEVINKIKRSINLKDIVRLKSVIDSVNIESINEHRAKYESLFMYRNNLIDRTVFFSIITAITIVFCLLAIPFGKILLKHHCILYLLFFMVIICLAFIFYQLISILKEALKESAV